MNTTLTAALSTIIHTALDRQMHGIQTHTCKHITAKHTHILAQSSKCIFRYEIGRQNLRSACSGEHMAEPLMCMSLEFFMHTKKCCETNSDIYLSIYLSDYSLILKKHLSKIVIQYLIIKALNRI